MRAIRQHSFGGPDVLRLEEVPDPRPDDGQVRIRVESAGVHLIDALTRRGEVRGPFPLPELPVTLGREVAGVVDAAGPDVDEGLVGRRVVADVSATGAGYAELALAPASALHELPEELDPDQAVAMIGTGRTTMAILDVAAATADDVAVVTAAAGGVGTLLIQALRQAGATVVGLATGEDKVALVRELDATSAVDYSQQGWPEAVREALEGQPVTLVLDGVGGPTGRTAFELVEPGGRLVMFGSAAGTLTQLSAEDLFGRGVTATPAVGTRLFRRPGGMRPLETQALEAAATGQLRPVIGQRFPLADAAAAHRALEARTTTGKVVLRA